MSTLPSTQDEARRRAHDSREPIVVVANSQTEGRGRTGRTWLEAPRAMYSSLAFRPEWPAEKRPRLTLVAGLAVRGALGRATGVQPGLKWPNDLVVPLGKVGGILTESEGDVVVIGCGVNLWWPGAPEGIAAICAADPSEELAPLIARSWAERVLDATTHSPDAWRRDDYRTACVTLGTDVEWDGGGPGHAVDVDVDGALIVDTADGLVSLGSGEVRSVRRVG